MCKIGPSTGEWDDDCERNRLHMEQSFRRSFSIILQGKVRSVRNPPFFSGKGVESSCPLFHQLLRLLPTHTYADMRSSKRGRIGCGKSDPCSCHESTLSNLYISQLFDRNSMVPFNTQLAQHGSETDLSLPTSQSTNVCKST